MSHGHIIPLINFNNKLGLLGQSQSIKWLAEVLEYQENFCLILLQYMTVSTETICYVVVAPR